MLGPYGRWSLRCRTADVAAISVLLDLELPANMGSSAVKAQRAALLLGPDEWLLRSAADDKTWVHALTASEIFGRCSLVDVSHRQVAFLIDWTAAEDVLTLGCPLDLTDAAFPTGMCTRTVFGKAEVLLWRVQAGLVLETARSFGNYISSLLIRAERDSRW